MKINQIIRIFESKLLEISTLGGLDATKMSKRDFAEVLKFLRAVEPIEATLQKINAALNLIRNESAADYVFGKTSNIRKSAAVSSDRDDEEKRIPAFAGPEEKTSKVSGEQSEITSAVVRILEKMGYVIVDSEREIIDVRDRESISRIRKFLQIAIDKSGVNDPTAAIQKFEQLVQDYQRTSAEKLTPREETIPGGEVVKKITPNILIFLATVSKNYKSKKAWDTYLNPENYSAVDTKTKGFFEYDPKQAANDLVEMGLAQKTGSGYMLNREGIKNTVKNFAEIISSNMSGAKIEDPTNKRGVAATAEEKKARDFINFMKTHFSDKAWNNAQKHVFSFMRGTGGSYEKALSWYLGAKDSVTDPNNPDPSMSKGLERVQKTLLGTIIDFATARYLTKKMLFDAKQILGQKPQMPKSFVTSRDISLAGTVYEKGIHKKPARV